MTKIRLMLNVMAVLAVCLICSTLAQAQATRTWVSGVGDDANPCSRTAPCKTFAGAISKTAPLGEINVLDPGGFGAVTITKSITISSECFEAGVLVSGTNGIVISAGPSDKVKLRGLDINGLGTGLSGIKFLTGGQLTVENCWIYEFSQNGVDIQAANASTGANIYVKDTRITQINGDAIHLQTSQGFIVANIDNVRMEGNGNGLVGTNNTFGNITRSSVFQNTTNGISASSGSTMNVESCVISHNATGINAPAGSSFLLSNASIFNNGTGINVAGTVRGFFNNRVFGNGTNGAVNQQTAQQ
jgi:hypothetical protein